MKKILFVIFACVTTIYANQDGFVLKKNTAQYKGSDFSNVVQVERGITLENACMYLRFL